MSGLPEELRLTKVDFGAHPNPGFPCEEPMISASKAAEIANALLAERLKTIRFELGLVDVSKYDDNSLWLQRHDGEGMQLIISEEWWKKNF